MRGFMPRLVMAKRVHRMRLRCWLQCDSDFCTDLYRSFETDASGGIDVYTD